MTKEICHKLKQQADLCITSSTPYLPVAETEASQLCNQILNIEHNFFGVAEAARKFCNSCWSVSSDIPTPMGITEHDIDTLSAREISLLLADQTSALKEDTPIIDINLGS